MPQAGVNGALVESGYGLLCAPYDPTRRPSNGEATAMTSTYPVPPDRGVRGTGRQGAESNGLPGPRDAGLDVLAPMRATAVRVLTQHVSGEGRCVVCGCAWPCELVVLADHNLGAV